MALYDFGIDMVAIPVLRTIYLQLYESINISFIAICPILWVYHR